MPDNKICGFLQASVSSDSFSDCGTWGQKHLQSPCLKNFISQNYSSSYLSPKI